MEIAEIKNIGHKAVGTPQLPQSFCITRGSQFYHTFIGKTTYFDPRNTNIKYLY